MLNTTLCALAGVTLALGAGYSTEALVRAERLPGFTPTCQSCTVVNPNPYPMIAACVGTITESVVCQTSGNHCVSAGSFTWTITTANPNCTDTSGGTPDLFYIDQEWRGTAYVTNQSMTANEQTSPQTPPAGNYQTANPFNSPGNMNCSGGSYKIEAWCSVTAFGVPDPNDCTNCQSPTRPYPPGGNLTHKVWDCVQ